MDKACLPRWSSFAALLTVVGAHAGGVAIMLFAFGREAEVVSVPTIEGVVIPLPPAEEVQAPSRQEEIAPPEPLPAVKPVPKPRPKPEREPPPELPPSETAITAPPEPEPAETAPAPPSVPTAIDDDTLAAPVSPPFVDANQVTNPAPTYPAASRRLREQGTVLLDVLILPDGSVGEAHVRRSSGYQRLDDTALEAVLRWRYRPARRGNEPIPYWYVQPLEFSLR